MKAPLVATVCAVLIGLVSIPSPSIAQQKTVKQCQDEWRANKAENQAKGIKEKDYVAQCRAGTAATTTPVQTQTSAASAPAPAAAKGKTAKECRAEWQANKADNQAKGITEKAYVAQCRAGATAAAPASTPAATEMPPPPSASPATPAAPPAKPAVAPAPRRTAAPVATAPTGEGQYATETEAKGRCPGDTVVWINLDSKVYHFAGTKNYGTTKQGAYMCEKNAMAQGGRASKAEKHP